MRQKSKIGKLPPEWLEPDAQRAGVQNNGNGEDKATIRVQKDSSMLCCTTILRMRHRELNLTTARFELDLS